MKWKITYFNDSVFNDINQLPKKIKARLLVLTERMEVLGPNLGMPHTKAFGDGLFEIRVKASEGIARIFYCTCIDNEIVLLSAFVKKTQQTPQKELKLAQRRLKEVKENG